MKHNREYEIAWQGLKLGVHTFQYELNDRFVEEKGKEDADFKDLDALVTLRFDKKKQFLPLSFRYRR